MNIRWTQQLNMLFWYSPTFASLQYKSKLDLQAENKNKQIL